MAETGSEIVHVSDTALMTAACRAIETERPDGFVRDPFAARLAGERGMAIGRAIPRLWMMCFGIGIRTHFIDELVVAAVRDHGISTVLSLGCGLDTRPWRLDLPSSLRWVEVDFPEMLDYKWELMRGETPACRLERRTADLNDAAQRREIYAAAAGPALMITEGLLMYLPGATIEGLASETLETAVRHWMADITSPTFAAAIGMSSYQSIRNVQPEDHLDGLQILDVVARRGWHTGVRRSYITDMAFAAGRIAEMQKNMPADYKPPTNPVPPDDPTGVHLFAR
jgi:methyltransferase (TIGR00027 family)